MKGISRVMVVAVALAVLASTPAFAAGGGDLGEGQRIQAQVRSAVQSFVHWMFQHQLGFIGGGAAGNGAGNGDCDGSGPNGGPGGSGSGPQDGTGNGSGPNGSGDGVCDGTGPHGSGTGRG